MNSGIRSLLCTGIVLAAASGFARAETTYTSESSFAASVSGLSTVTFDGIVAANLFAGEPAGITVGGVKFAAGPNGLDNSIFVIGTDYYNLGAPVVSAQGNTADGINDLLITLPTPQTAVGLHFFVDPGTVTITLSDGSKYTVIASDTPTSDFFGITGTLPITSLEISIPFTQDFSSASVNVSSFSFGSAAASPVPEPSSLALLATGLVGVGGTLRKKLARA